MVDHTHIQENLDAYLAGDLTTSERENVEQHAATCDSCKQALAEARQLEQVMHGLFADARPSANLDDRIIQELLKEPVRSFRRPTMWRFVATAAAVLVVGLVGAIVQAITMEGGWQGAELRVATDAQESQTRLLLAKRSYFGYKGKGGEGEEAPAHFERGVHEKELDRSYSSKLKELTELADMVQYDINRPAKPSDPEAKQQQRDIVTLPAYGALIEANEAKEAKDDVLKGSLDTVKKAFDLKKYEQPDLADGKKREEGRGGREGKDKLAGGGAAPGGSSRVQFAPVFVSPIMQWAVPNPMIENTVKLHAPVPLPVAASLPPPVYYEMPPQPVSTESTSATPSSSRKSSAPFFYPSFPAPAPPSPPSEPENKRGEKKDSLKESPKSEPVQDPSAKDGKGKDDIAQAPKKQPSAPEKKPAPVEPPMETNRKIIRTGEMEFEIDSFDKSVDSITQLITAVKGGFVATINSDKLANGKMRGSIVVRMPPQYLDQFVLALRRELAKTGELKNQRIISLDVTKQYTDIESRLRAARTMEDRLIQIIKIGKGDIKDLVAAEHELGVWRTKIEEMEGEIRYYANQVALSTLTITLNEKEILAPTAIVVTESVRMRLEVDDVAKAHQIAMNAVEEVKGRITKSELKQHSAGQLQSILAAEIPPAKRDIFTEKLKKLGILSDHEENQRQHTEGGVGKGAQLKPRLDDVHFDITMHNTANVRPRVTADLKIATNDVPGVYARILEDIAKAKGQVRDAKLSEQDKLNITGFIDFNVPSAEKKAMDKILADIGPVLERVNVRAPVNELSTERKFGYTLLLRDFASIPPSKAVVQIIAVADVPASYARLREAIAKASGLLVDAKLDEKDKLNVNAQLDFTVVAEEKPAIDKVLVDLGSVLSRTNVDAPMKQLSTPKKFGYTLVLRDFASIPPSKASELRLAVSDVQASYARLQEAIAKAKGQMIDAKLDEKDKFNISAQLSFSVPSEERAGLDKLLADMGAVLSRNNVQVPATQLSTAKKFGYSIDLRDFASIPASQASDVKIALSNVPGNYAKLLEAIAAAKGQIADAKLNEQDKLNVTGQLSFTVPSAAKPAIEKLLAEIGTTLSRTNARAPATALATDRKVGYAVELRDFANIAARDTFIVQIALSDVPTSFREFQQAVSQARGWVSLGNLVEDNKSKIGAQFNFDVPTAEKATIEKLIVKTGAVLSRTSSQVPVNLLATDQKVGFQITLRSIASIPPREKTLIKFEVTDVDGEATQLKDLIIAGKGRVVDSSIDRYENGQVAAALVFEVPFASQDTLIRQMKGVRKLVSQKTTRDPQVPENDLTTAYIIVSLTGGDPVLPNDRGVGTYVRNSFNLSFQILAIIVMTVIVGLSAILPLALIIWIGYKVYAFATGTGKVPAAVVKS